MSMDRGTLTRLSMQRLSKRFSRNRDYNKVDDVNDTRVPLHNEDVFGHGLTFKAKFVGSLEIARPQSKVDIITAMRRIRYEYKVKGIKKQRCIIDVSTKGVKVSKRRRRRKREYTDDELLMMQHPIYRIFYVSHDSQDLKIFSYITRESSDNSFHCNVFKAYKKRMALHIVRSLGQAFDVCHKLNPRPKKKKKNAVKDGEEVNEVTQNDKENPDEVKEPSPDKSKEDDSSTNIGDTVNTAQDSINSSDDPFRPLNSTFASKTPPLINFDPFAPLAPPPPAELQISGTILPPPQMPYVVRPRPKAVQSTIRENPLTASSDSLGKITGFDSSMSPSASLGEPLSETDGPSTHPRAQQWEGEKQQFAAQMALLREQLQGETAARIESQARVEHLLLQNKELLSHLQKLMVQLQQLQSLQITQQQQNQNQTPVIPPVSDAVPDSTQTPPTTEPEDTSSDLTEQKPLDTSHDQTATTSDSSPNTSHDQATLDKAFSPDSPSDDQSKFDEAFKAPNETTHNQEAFEKAFDLPPDKPMNGGDSSSHNQQALDEAFKTPNETTYNQEAFKKAFDLPPDNPMNGGDSSLHDQQALDEAFKAPNETTHDQEAFEKAFDLPPDNPMNGGDSSLHDQQALDEAFKAPNETTHNQEAFKKAFDLPPDNPMNGASHDQQALDEAFTPATS